MAKQAKKPSMPTARRYGIKPGGKLKDFTSPSKPGGIESLPVASETREFKHIDVAFPPDVTTDLRDQPLTVVPDVTDTATYRSLFTEIEKDLRDDQRSFRWRTFRSLLFRH